MTLCNLSDVYGKTRPQEQRETLLFAGNKKNYVERKATTANTPTQTIIN